MSANALYRGTSPQRAHGWINFGSPHNPDTSANEKIEQFAQWKAVYEKEMKSLYNRNLSRAQEAVEKLISQLNQKKGIQVRDAYIKTNSIQEFSALLMVDYATFIDDEFREAYSLAEDIEEELEEEIFNIQISFASVTENTDQDKIICQGYVFKRQPNEQS
jgi:hypothetical protein